MEAGLKRANLWGWVRRRGGPQRARATGNLAALRAKEGPSFWEMVAR